MLEKDDFQSEEFWDKFEMILQRIVIFAGFVFALVFLIMLYIASKIL